jgi:hypothetical protein
VKEKQPLPDKKKKKVIIEFEDWLLSEN